MAMRERARAQKREAARPIGIEGHHLVHALWRLLEKARPFLRIPETDVVIARARKLTRVGRFGDLIIPAKELEKLRKLLGNE